MQCQPNPFKLIEQSCNRSNTKRLFDISEDRHFENNSSSLFMNGQSVINLNSINKHLEKDMFLPRINIGNSHKKMTVISKLSKRRLNSQLSYPVEFGYKSIKQFIGH